MKLSRDQAAKIHIVLDQLLPPIVRDFPPFTRMLAMLAYGNGWRTIYDFREHASSMTDEEFREVYRRVKYLVPERITNLNRPCIDKILTDFSGSSVLDAGCGDGYLTRLLAEKVKTTGYDMLPPADDPENIEYHAGFLEKMPFADKSFDTVVCAHTMEHIRNFHQVLHELRRVCAEKLIIIVPLQREYRFTFDLHLQYFPYPHSFLDYIGVLPDHLQASTTVLGGDLYYSETRN